MTTMNTPPLNGTDKMLRSENDDDLFKSAIDVSNESFIYFSPVFLTKLANFLQFTSAFVLIVSVYSGFNGDDGK